MCSELCSASSVEFSASQILDWPYSEYVVMFSILYRAVEQTLSLTAVNSCTFGRLENINPRGDIDLLAQLPRCIRVQEAKIRRARDTSG